MQRRSADILAAEAGAMKHFQEIPIISLASLTCAAPGERRACAKEIGRACREVGFFTAVDHGIDDMLIERVFALARDFFARPLDEKLAVRMRAETGWRGYFPLEGETTDPAFGKDPKEGFDIAVAPTRLPGVAEHAAIPWPAQPPEMREVLTAYHEALCDLGRLISRGFALALDLPEDFFAARLERPTAILRILHYPPVERVADPAGLPPFGCGAHSDYGYLTMLAQDDQGGLQVQNLADQWIDVPPLEGAFVCNIGELMGRWTNDRFRATPHRVVRVKPGSRYSIPFFFHPNQDVLVETLPTCIDAEHPAHYPPVTSGEYILQRLSGGYV